MALLAVAASIIAATGLAAGGLPAAAQAAASPWSVQQVPPLDTATPHALFNDVSCPTATFCMAVGQYIGTDGNEHPLAQERKGGTWRLAGAVSTPGAVLTDVSCPSTRSCEAIGQLGTASAPLSPLFAESWNGRSWRRVPVPAGNVFLTAMSCATASSCLAVGDQTAPAGYLTYMPMAEHWNGHRWSTTLPRRPLHFSYLQGVSCPAARSCYAVGWDSRIVGSAGRALIEHWNGARWSTRAVTRPAKGDAALQSISCPTTTSCTSVGALGFDNVRPLVADLSKGKWTEGLPGAPGVAGGTTYYYAVSCTAPRVCTALVNWGGEEQFWATASRGATGGFTPHVPAFDTNPDRATALSCRPLACELIGGRAGLVDGSPDKSRTQARAETGTGPVLAWRDSDNRLTAQAAPVPPGTNGGFLSAVSCVASGFCAAAAHAPGYDGLAAPADQAILIRTRAGGPWTVPAGSGTTNSGTPSVVSISCTSAAFCLALDSGNGVRLWNGSSWATSPTPAPAGLDSVSCRSATACVAVGHTAADTWNGSTWTALSPAAPAGALSMSLDAVSCTSPTHCVAAGYVSLPGLRFLRTLVETWNDGTGWTIGSPTEALLDGTGPSVSCATPSACMVTWGNESVARSMWWNGTAWSAATFDGEPNTRNYPTAVGGVSCPTAMSCTAVGSFFHKTGQGTLVQSWNGHKWANVPVANPALGIGALAAVSCPSVTACTAVGGNQRHQAEDDDELQVPLAEVRG
jgi:hypothetical protein